MAHFQAGIQGNRGPATRLGTAKSGIYAFARGWDGGARIDLWQGKNGEDYISVSVGSHSYPRQYIIAQGPIKDILAKAKEQKPLDPGLVQHTAMRVLGII